MADYLLIFSAGNYRQQEFGGGLDEIESVFDMRFDTALLPNARYPLTDWKDCPLTPNLFMFAFPQVTLLPHDMLHLPHPTTLSPFLRCFLKEKRRKENNSS